MLEYLAYRRYKKHKTEKEARELAKKEAEEQLSNPGYSSSSQGKLPGTQSPPLLLDQNDEAWLESILTGPDDEGSRPPLPARTSDTGLESDSSSSRHSQHRGHRRSQTAASVASSSTLARSPSSRPRTAVKEKETEREKRSSHNPISLLLNRGKDKDKDKQLAHPRRDPAAVIDPDEAERERDDLNSVLDDLNLGATRNNKAFALSPDNNELVRKFTLVLKDLVNGVPTAVDDLRSLIDDRDGTLKRNYDKLPDSMKKLVANLPDKVSNQLGPDVLAAAAASQGINHDGKTADRGGNMKDTAKSLFMPKNLQEIITKPSAIIGMLKAIVNFLKLRWPAFIGVNVVWSIAIFLLLLVLWYCHKRGREVRLERERSQQAVDGSGRVEELPDDPMLPAPPSRASSYRSVPVSPASSRSRSGRGTPRRRSVSPPLESPRRRKTHR